jgi:hypothetical protein
MGRKASERVATRNPNTGRPGPRIARERYEPLRSAILRTAPARESGLTFGELLRGVKPLLPAAPFRGASVSWYFTVVKLDLEARGLLRRVGERPHRLIQGARKGL